MQEFGVGQVAGSGLVEVMEEKEIATELEELDRRIAIEIMGDGKPAEYPSRNIHSRSEGGCWQGVWVRGGYYDAVYDWRPIPFSGSIELAMRAVDKVLDGSDEHILEIVYDNHEGPRWTAYVRWLLWDQAYDEVIRESKSLPESICKVLAAYVEKMRESSGRTDGNPE